MSQTFIIKRRTDKIDESPTIEDLKQSILDVRKAYSDGTDEEFARFYRRRYKVSDAFVLKVLRDQDKILELRSQYPEMALDQFAEMMHTEHRIKQQFVNAVLKMHKETGK